MAIDIPVRQPRNIFETATGNENVLNELTKQNIENKYLPYTKYADAASKIAYSNLLPYQIKAQLMSNPLVWMALKDNPEAIKSFMGSFQNSIPQGNNVFGNVNIPKPEQQSGNGVFSGLLGQLINKLTGNNSPINSLSNNNSPMNNSSQDFGSNNKVSDNEVNNFSNGLNFDGTPRTAKQDHNALLPSAGGDANAVIGSKTAPYYEQTHKPGTLFYDPDTGESTSTPTENTVTQQQQAINAAERVIPQLERLADVAAPFLNVKGQGHLLFERGKNFLFPESKKPGKLPTQYAEYKSLIQSAPEALVKSYGLRPTNETIERMQKVIEPIFGETKEQYKDRIIKQLAAIKNEQIAISSQQLSHGFKVEGGKNSSSKNTINIPKFKNKKQGIDWFNSQPKDVQDAIRRQLGNK